METKNDEVQRGLSGSSSSSAQLGFKRKLELLSPIPTTDRYTEQDFEEYTKNLNMLNERYPMFLSACNKVCQKITANAFQDTNSLYSFPLNKASYRILKVYEHDTMPFFEWKNFLRIHWFVNNVMTIKNYLLETKALNAQISQENEHRKTLNSEAEGYNTQLQTRFEEQVKKKVLTLQKWSDCIEFEGQKFGFPWKTYNGVHRENDCMGKVRYSETLSTYCEKCRQKI